MSYESLRFGWQKLLVNQVPQKGGGRGAPPPDYAGQWATAQTAFNRGVQVVDEVRATYGRIAANPTEAPALIEANNAKLNAEINNMNNIINQTGGIPDYIFSTSDISKPEAVSILTAARDNMSRCLATVPPPPPQPLPIPAPPTIRVPVTEVIPLQPIIVSGNGEWVNDGVIQGTGSWVPGKDAIGQAVICYADDGNQYSTPALVPAGRRWSYTRWRWQHNNVQLPPPPPLPPPPTALEILQAELAKQTDQLRRINRIMNKPIDPAPPQDVYPSTSWQYEFWNKGYSLHEVTYAEEQAAQRSLLTSTNGDFALFKAKVEDLLQDAILAGSVPPAISQEIISPPRCGFDPVTLQPTIPPGLLNPSIEQPYQPGFTVDVRDALAPVPPRTCQLPMPYFDREARPIDPKKVPPRLRRERVFQSRGVRNRPIDIGDLPDVPTICPAVMPRIDNWEDCLVGAGATVDELDTVRRTMARSKLAPNADVCNVAKNMLTNVRNQVSVSRGQPAIVSAVDGNGNPIPPQQPVMFGANTMNNIPGVVRCGVSSTNVVRSNLIAQRKAQQARRGVLNSRK
jgi:hypothetical protein